MIDISDGLDAEPEALDQRARNLRQRRVRQLGDLVITTGCDSLPIDVLAGALLAIGRNTDVAVREFWRAQGAEMLQRTVEASNLGVGNTAPSAPKRR